MRRSHECNEQYAYELAAYQGLLFKRELFITNWYFTV